MNNNSICLITNIPAPYREKIHEIVASKIKKYQVIYCQERESNRKWTFKTGEYKKIFLKGNVLKYQNRYIHFNPSILNALNKFNPDIVITYGFNPTNLLAFSWSLVRKKKHISFIDGWLGSEESLSFLHKVVRKIVYKYTKAFIGPSIHTLNMYKQYGCPERAIFQSHLCVDNKKFTSDKNNTKEFDIMFSGQIINSKLPLFFANIAGIIKKETGSCRALVIGDGAQKEMLLNKLTNYDISFEFAGFIQQEYLPEYYKKSKLFLFPTLNECWGVVANEACAAGVPVITCENAGAARDLIIHDVNGYVLPLDEKLWAKKIIYLLNNENVIQEFSRNAIEKVKEYNFNDAAQGIVDAINYAVEN